MKKNKVRVVGFSRKRKNLTNYRKRLNILSSKKPRLVIRKSLKNIQASIVEYKKEGDVIKVSSHSSNLKKFGWNYNTGNLPAAYLVGFLIGKKAKKNKLSDVVLDLGLQKSVKGSKIYALLMGVLDAGLNVPHNKDILPSKDRIIGKHISNYKTAIKNDEATLKKQFGICMKNGADPENISKKFEEVKNNIDKNG